MEGVVKRIYKQGAAIGVVLLGAVVVLAVVNTRVGRGRDPSRVLRPDYLATIETDYGNITIRLFTNKAPNTVGVFVDLVRQKFYDGLGFNIVDKERHVIAGGIPPRSHAPDWAVPMEENDLKFDRGMVAMFDPIEGSDMHNTAFLITTSSQPSLKGFVTIFGKVVEGMDVVDRIQQVETSGAEGRPPFHPLEPVVIRRITVREAP